MAKILVLCFTLITLSVIAESKSLSNAADLCQDCPEAVVAEEGYKRSKRAETTAVLNSISGLVTGILETNWRYIAKINADKMNARRRTLIIGPGTNNYNRVMFNRNQGYDYNDYGSRRTKQSNQGYDYSDYDSRTTKQSNQGYDYNDNGSRTTKQSNQGYDYNDYGSRTTKQSNQGYDYNDYDSRTTKQSNQGYGYNDYGSRNNNNRRNQRNYNGYNNYNEYEY